MAASFTYAAVYHIEAECRTPLRTGGSSGDVEQVLRHGDGTPFLQGTSLAGALRGWLDAVDQEQAKVLFGSPKRSEQRHHAGELIVSDARLEQAEQSEQRRQAGELIVSDARLEQAEQSEQRRQAGELIVSDTRLKPAEQYIRPRVRIDRKNGVAADDAKFNVAHIAPGTKMTFTLVWLSRTPVDDSGVIREMLNALHSGEITLGALKTNGFGKVALESVQYRVLDMRKPEHRDVWLEWDGFSALTDSDSLELPKKPRSRGTVFTVAGSCGSILVKAEAPLTEAVIKADGREEEVQYTPNITENDRPILPGSSVKGAVRARAEAIADFLRLDRSFTDRLFGREALKSQETEKKDNGLPGRVRFEDVLLSGEAENRQKCVRIRIDRFTGSVIRQGLFREEPVRANRLTLRITAPDGDAERGLLLYALRDLGLGLYNLGGNGAIGRGFVEVESITAETPDGNQAVLRFGEQDGIRRVTQVEDKNNLFLTWTEALKNTEVRCENRDTDG